MDLYFLHHEEFLERYNCSMKTDKEWADEGSPSFLIGGFCVGIGSLYLALYIPCLIVMKKPELFTHSCFKVMFFLGILDCMSVVYNCLLGGIFSLLGLVACPYVMMHYFVGASSIAVWCTQCGMCILLALNRCSDLWNVWFLQKLYEGKKVYAAIAIPFCYGLFALWFTRGCPFSSKAYAYFFDPYFLIDGLEVDHSYYSGYLLSVNNIAVSSTLTILHVFLLFSVWWKTRGASSANLSKLQRQLFLQAFCICSLNFIGASLYVYMQFFPVPYFLILVAEFTWQGCTGGAVFIYLVLNRTIRNGVISLFCGKKLWSNSTHPSRSLTYGEGPERSPSSTNTGSASRVLSP
ncbi:hypothetical protein QR680_015962 [Steinernema hermaphroditum]|uniref:7TM GPCR serpentine receptor class x (Srx) domain-containing protein n=1 Tax=Steinernema hermaphroditum TaxID=289476 RepID=A0AA39H9V3_9BILA|nr:hypothetical protein QR680_015962 [Steinernema hermaphroditum]